MPFNKEKLFEKIFDQTHGKIYNFVLHLTNDSFRAEEITQNCFIKLWLNMDQLDHTKDPFPLLFVYAKNLFFDEVRKMKNEYQLLSEIKSKGEAVTNSTEEKFRLNELNSLINNAVEKLPEKRKVIYKLSREEGLNHNEIADKIGISPNTVKNQITDALKFIKDELSSTY
ncbi:RNA polymerase sigma-70 factor [Solitalea canadensis]|uniref:RNA polymerase sigma-70 factor, Bacteroides expansion family 1 n=1 Tax=Solitalea canadensis (strain ATCC 29591 / DSM 3403 / JCM 21819 / LMG 8368 / NBRC 15130 / NCIMB 12057 / USAM 9D) TaxID=929556 RepID=H8KUB8_SOLCM|nr:RNA polymerase sigma-70 factor [Solitalea canadensis]AFD07230.1 RNA polymerase sigma-70 factor, Bacteroides expansion family 1 [Solitalea canadensis DSM 3403]